MEKKRGLFILAAPVLGICLLGAVLILRRTEEGPVQKPTHTRVEARPPAHTPSRAVPSKPSEPAVIARATDVARLRATFQNYRTAIATENRILQDALRPALLQEHPTVLQLAQEELARARDPFDRDIAQRTLETLRR